MATESDNPIFSYCKTEKISPSRCMEIFEELPDLVPPKYGVKATTLLEFFSVSIQRDTQQEELNDGGSSSFQIYGHIKLTYHYGKEFFLFNREHGNPETVSMLDNRTTILPKPEGYCPRWLPEYFWVEVYLVDKSRNVTIVDHKKRQLDFVKPNVDYDEELQLIFPRRGYERVTLNYAVFRSAVLAVLSLKVSKKNGNDEDVVAVTGSISASTIVKGKRGISRVLCDIQRSMSLSMDRYTCLSAIAMPPYSLLRIKADLVVDGERIVTGDDAWEFNLDDPLPDEPKEIMAGEWRIHCLMYRAHPYCHLELDEFVGELLSYDSYKELHLSGGKEDQGEEFSESEESCSNEEWFIPLRYARNLVEVFSIYVGSFSHERPLRVCGTIKYHSRKEYTIFERAELEPETVSPKESISLVNPPLWKEEFLCGGFAIDLDLKDARGRELSKGSVSWGIQQASFWYDMRLCSVVTGEHGFACVHYAIFDSAVYAKVRARITHSGCSDGYFFCVFSGSIYARYSAYRYSTSYEKSFYRSTLFKEKKKHLGPSFNSYIQLFKEDYLPPPPGFSSYIPLSKEAVAVPSDSKLILEVNICAWCGVGLEETFRGELEFYPKDSTTTCAEIEAGSNSPFICEGKSKSPYILELKVEWDFN